MTGSRTHALAIVTSLVLLQAVASFGALVSFTASAEKTKVSLDDQIIVSVQAVSNTKLKNPGAPALASADWYSLLRTTQNQSQSTSVQLINGKMTQKAEITYQYHYFLSPKKVGTFTFPALTMSDGGKTYATRPFNVTITKNAVSNPDIRVSLAVASRQLYVGEQTVLTIEVAQKPKAPVAPTNAGFTLVVENTEEALKKHFSVARLFQNQLNPATKRIGGETYQVYELPFSIVALGTGTAKIASVPFQYDELSQARSHDPFFGGFFGSSVRRTPKTTRTNSLTIEVRDLPSPPSDFTGAVGSFRLDASVSPTEVRAGDAVTLKIGIRGDTRPGNMAELVMPAMDDFEVFSPEKHTYVDTSTRGISTRLSLKYLIVPRERGNKAFGPITWTYFDPKAEKYKTLSSDTLRIKVTEGKSISREQTRYLTQEDIREVGSDIRYIKTPEHLKAQLSSPHRNPVFIFLYPLPFLLALFSLLYRIQAQKKEENSARFQQRRAHGRAMRSLSRLAKKGPDKKNDESAAVADILDSYLSQRFQFAAVGKTMDDLRRELTENRIPEETMSQTVSFREGLDSSRFSGKAGGDQSLEGRITTLRNLIDTIEREAKKKGKA